MIMYTPLAHKLWCSSTCIRMGLGYEQGIQSSNVPKADFGNGMLIESPRHHNSDTAALRCGMDGLFWFSLAE